MVTAQSHIQEEVQIPFHKTRNFFEMISFPLLLTVLSTITTSSNIYTSGPQNVDCSNKYYDLTIMSCSDCPSNAISTLQNSCECLSGYIKSGDSCVACPSGKVTFILFNDFRSHLWTERFAYHVRVTQRPHHLVLFVIATLEKY